MVTLGRAESQDHLLEERQRLVDELGFSQQGGTV
jgi:hypothetical protein